jgi:hypothetical protein
MEFPSFADREAGDQVSRAAVRRSARRWSNHGINVMIVVAARTPRIV